MSSNNPSGAVSRMRDIAPSHYILKIESFSCLTKMLSESRTQLFISNFFKASGYKWKFSMYPNGDGDSYGHISVFLHIEDTNAFPLGWEIYTDLKFFIFDQKRDRYSIFQAGEVNRFHALKPECGIAKLVSRHVFDDAANGYLVNNMCVFGVEVFVLDSKFVGQYLKKSVNVDEVFTWRVSGYSNLSSDGQYSDEFTACSFQWKLRLYPFGIDPKVYGVKLALFLELVTCAELFVHCMFRIRNQKSGEHRESYICKCFGPESSCWGCPSVMSLTDLRDLSKGFLVNDCVIIEAHINNISAINK